MKSILNTDDNFELVIDNDEYESDSYVDITIKKNNKTDDKYDIWQEIDGVPIDELFFVVKSFYDNKERGRQMDRLLK